jgi:hypothetical protein
MKELRQSWRGSRPSGRAVVEIPVQARLVTQEEASALEDRRRAVRAQFEDRGWFLDAARAVSGEPACES